MIDRIRGVPAVNGGVFLKWAPGIGLRSSSKTAFTGIPPPPLNPATWTCHTQSSLQSELCLLTLKLQKELEAGYIWLLALLLSEDEN